jgi:site-specific DNA-methyltransferase (adenine-specific)
MTSQSAFVLRGRNPDILTCIANLSNDEVFTPPELANQMLDTLAQAWAANNDGANIWADKTISFLDPCTKSGVFLREITSRLTEGLKDAIPDLQNRVDHILTKQVFGIGITQITSLLARRSVYCSKNATGEHSIAESFTDEAGNIWFERTKHTWEGNKCKYCGANQRDYDRGPELETHAYAFIHTDDLRKRLTELFGGKMQFDVVIGNPPYQLGQSGGEAVGGFAMPIYQEFVRAAKRLDPKFVIMITPSRWFAGGRGLDEYRSEMLNDKRIRALVDFPDASHAFPGTQIKGGVSYFLWDHAWDDECEVATVKSDGSVVQPMRRPLNAYDVLVRWNDAVSILEKVLSTNAKEGHGNLSGKVSPIQPFSIRTNFRGAGSKSGMKSPVLLIGNKSETYIERSDVPRNDSWIDDWKVLLGQAYGAGDDFPHQIYNHPIVARPGTACTETYLVIDRFKKESDAKRFADYLCTRFVRFLVSLRKNTQHIYNERFQFVPDLSMDREWTDKDLYKKYKLTKKEIEFIESMIRPMDADDE